MNDNTLVFLIHPGDLIEYANGNKELKRVLGIDQLNLKVEDNPIIIELTLN
jgi:hypothetical protein